MKRLFLFSYTLIFSYTCLFIVLNFSYQAIANNFMTQNYQSEIWDQWRKSREKDLQNKNRNKNPKNKPTLPPYTPPPYEFI